MDYSKHLNVNETPQAEPIPGSAQVANRAGGFAWALDDWGRLHRFLILGTEGGTYYITERTLTLENAAAVQRCIQADGARAVQIITEVSEAGRAPKNDPAVFALAMCVAFGDVVTKQVALGALPRVCRIGTHLFHFLKFYEALRPHGKRWGRQLRRAGGAWYQRPIETVAGQAIKYVQRDGWSHNDALQLAHPKPPTIQHRALFRYITRPGSPVDGLPELVEAVERLKTATDPKEIIRTIRDHRLPREAIETANTEWLKRADVWEALLDHIPMEAMIRNLGVMTNRGLLAPLSHAAGLVVARLADEQMLRKARIHPIRVLAALLTYRGGESRGGVAWTPVTNVVDALDAAFYRAFGYVIPSGKRLMLALDVSGSMTVGDVAGVRGLTPRAAAAAMALVTAAVEPNHFITGFFTGEASKKPYGGQHGAYGGRFGADWQSGIAVLAISPKQRLDDVIAQTDNLPFGGTDCALPMLYALANNIPVDGFVILTDNETWAGGIHPAQALAKYREAMGIPAALVVVGMVSNGFTVADPKDPGMLDVVGFDLATPQFISDFVGGMQ